MGMTDPVPTFSYLVTELLARHPDLAYLHVTEKRLGTATPGGDIVSDDVFSAEGTENDFIRAIWSAAGDRRFTQRLKEAGFAVEELVVRGRGGTRGARHVIWVARRA